MKETLQTTNKTFAIEAINIAEQVGPAIALDPEKIIKNGLKTVFNGQSADAIIIMDTATVAGGGPATWALNNQQFLEELANSSDIPYLRVARGNQSPSFAVNGLTGRFPETNINLGIDPGTIPERFQQTEEVLTQTISQLALQGTKNIFVLSEGYSAYGPFAVNSAANTTRKSTGQDIKAVIVYQDNCVPDCDNPSWRTNSSGYPTDRFFPPAYTGIPGITEVFSIGTFSTPVNPGAEQQRANQYPGIRFMVAGYNFTPDYIQRISDFTQELSTPQARKLVEQYIQLPQNRNTPIISMTRNGIYWYEQPWMTKAQQQDIQTGTQTIAQALLESSQQIQNQIAVVMFEEAAEYLASLNLPGINIYSQALDNQSSGVLVIPKPEIPQDAFLALNNKVASCIIGASRGNNAQAETGFIGNTPLVVVSMPSNNYMGVSVMDPEAKLFGLPVFKPDEKPQTIASTLTQIISDPKYAQQLAQLEQQVVWKNYEQRNYFSTLQKLAGF